MGEDCLRGSEAWDLQRVWNGNQTWNTAPCNGLDWLDPRDRAGSHRSLCPGQQWFLQNTWKTTVCQSCVLVGKEHLMVRASGRGTCRASAPQDSPQGYVLLPHPTTSMATSKVLSVSHPRGAPEPKFYPWLVLFSWLQIPVPADHKPEACVLVTPPQYQTYKASTSLCLDSSP